MQRASEVLELRAYDPGGTTGWAHVWLPTACLAPGGPSILQSIEFEVGQLAGSDRRQGRGLATQLGDFVGPVVIEDFILRKFSAGRDLLAPVRMIARIEQIIELLLEYGYEPEDRGRVLRVYKQLPALAKSTCTDERMRRWGIWTPGKPHANDALRHAVTFLRRCLVDGGLAAEAFGAEVDL